MDILSYITVGLALSGPLVITVTIVRAVMTIDRSIRSKNKRCAILVLCSILGLLSMLALILAVWFGYGVAHTGKDAASDLTVLSATLIPAYLAVYLAWRWYLRSEKAMGFHTS